MTSFQIKLIALLTMTLDHLGLMLFPDQYILRIIGRLSFILFAWLLAEGARQTNNRMAYLKRLFTFALISQIPYSLMNIHIGTFIWNLNIFFTLAIGLGTIILQEQEKRTGNRAFLTIGACLLAEFFGADYGATGVLSILAFYYYSHNFKKSLQLQALIMIGFMTLPALLPIFHGLGRVMSLNSVAIAQPVSLLSFIFIKNYNHKEGPKMKYLFYAYYPLHLLVLYILTFVLE